MSFSSSTAARKECEFEPHYSVISQDQTDYFRRAKDNVVSALHLNKGHETLSADMEQSNPSEGLDTANCNSTVSKKIDLEEILPRFPGLTPEEDRKFRGRTLTPIAEWEGYVESIGESEFFVQMINVRSESPLPTDQAFFSMDDVSAHEEHLLKEGAIVRWVIGRERLPSGQIRKVSELYFRQLPAHSKADFHRALTKAKTLLEKINWDEDSRSG